MPSMLVPDIRPIQASVHISLSEASGEMLEVTHGKRGTGPRCCSVKLLETLAIS
jgi:hypothetical protein